VSDAARERQRLDAIASAMTMPSIEPEVIEQRVILLRIGFIFSDLASVKAPLSGVL